MALNSSSSCWRGEHSVSDKKWILVCANNDALEDDVGDGLTLSTQEGRRYLRAEFHLVDLKHNKIHRHCLPSLLQFLVAYSMAALDNFVYIFGYRSPFVADSPEFKQLQSRTPQTHQKILLEGSRLDLDQSLQTGWRPTPVPSKNTISPNCISLLGKIYTFGTGDLHPEVFDPVDGDWKSLCSQLDEYKLVGCQMSGHALPDPSNKRFLVHLYGGQLSSPSLYAFFPPDLHPADVDDTQSSGRVWECIAPDFQGWTEIAVVDDDVIYFHSRKIQSVVRAFDIANRAWLEVHWVSSFNDNFDFNDMKIQFDALFLLGNGILCLAAWSLVCSSNGQDTQTNITFYKFQAMRSGETIELTPLASLPYELPATYGVEDFLSV